MDDFGNWISKVDPTIAIGLVGGLITWLYHKAKGDKTQSIVDMLDAAITQEAHKILDDQGTMDDARKAFTKVGQEILDKLKIKQSATSDRWLAVAVEEGLAEFAQLITARDHAMQAALAALGAAGENMKAALVPPKNPTVPVLGVDIEEVKP